MTPGQYNSSLTRVQPFFEAAIALSPTGDGWLSALLCQAPHGTRALGDAATHPGALLPVLLGAHPQGKAPRGCFEYGVPPSRDLLRWYVNHPEHLAWPAGSSFGEETTRMRRALLFDDPPGAQQATGEALDLISKHQPSDVGWWRFEGISSIDCVLATDRIVVTVEGKRTEPLSPATDWYPSRTQIVRNLEAARQLAAGRAWGTIVISEKPIAEASADAVAASLDTAAPHLTEPERAELQARYLGNPTWAQACEATGIDYAGLPHTVNDI